MSNNSNNDDFNSKLAVLLIGIGSAALIVTVYHFVSMGWCNRRQPIRNSQRPSLPSTIQVMESPSMENSMAQLIPAYKYKRGMGLVGDEGETCAICLSEFEEGEELKTLPECTHTFHVECIDMWLFSHTNCPMCRTDATPSPQIAFDSIELGEGSEVYQNVGMLQAVVVHSRTM